MAFNKKTYVDGLTVISAENLNDIQDELLRLGAGSAAKTAGGTVVSQNADFAEVAEWADGNPDNEDRTGYFVCANVPVDGIVMKKATSLDDVKGVSILAPAFAGNYSKDKLDENGNLLPKYSFVAIIGFVPVIDNGTCTVGGRCMPDDNGCAVPSSNSMGYQVVNRIDENRVLIIIEPNGDMVQRIKTKINKLQDDVDNLTKEYELIEEIVVTEEAVVQRTYPKKYTNILVMFYSANKLPRARLTSGANYWEFYYTANQYSFVYMRGDIVAKGVYATTSCMVGNSGGSLTGANTISERPTQPVSGFYGFKTDGACKVGTTIKVYGVRA